MAIKKTLTNDEIAKDYQSKIDSAFNSGDYSSVQKYETARNSLIDKYKLNAAKTNYTYTPQYDTQINSLFNKLLNREDFSYNTANDPLYQQYKQQYVNQGKLAMQDTMGQAAALTGGYGSSYGQAVGQQQYDAYLQKLNEVVPELYQQAYSQYQDEGDELKDQYNMYLTKDAQDRENAQTYYSMMQDNYTKAQTAQAAAADQVDAILQAGGTPSSSLIKQSGYSNEYINTLKSYYKTKLAASSGSGSGSKSGSGSGSKNSVYEVVGKTVVNKSTGKVTYQPDSDSAQLLAALYNGELTPTEYKEYLDAMNAQNGTLKAK